MDNEPVEDEQPDVDLSELLDDYNAIEQTTHNARITASFYAECVNNHVEPDHALELTHQYLAYLLGGAE